MLFCVFVFPCLCLSFLYLFDCWSSVCLITTICVFVYLVSCFINTLIVVSFFVMVSVIGCCVVFILLGVICVGDFCLSLSSVVIKVLYCVVLLGIRVYTL